MRSHQFLLFIIIVIVLFVTILVLLYYFNTNPVEIVNTTKKCPPNQCATSLITGEKRCPINNGDSIDVLETEVCNLKNYCNNHFTPFPILENGETIDIRECPYEQCLCSTKRICPNYVFSYFKNENGSFILEDKNAAKTLGLNRNEYCISGLDTLIDLGCSVNLNNQDSIINCLNYEIVNFCPTGVPTVIASDVSEINSFSKFFCGVKKCDNQLQLLHDSEITCINF